MTYRIVIVPENVEREDEQVGSKAKFWYHDGKTRSMFKVGTPGTGDPWAEKVAEQIAAVVELPHAVVDLAECAAVDLQQPRGIVSPSFLTTRTDTLVLGNELLYRRDDAYPLEFGRRLPAHTLSVVLDALEGHQVKPPFGWTDHELTRGVEIFVGYLVLDAVIGNTDRHHQNWGVVTRWKGPLRLAPTFDHASSLGTKLRDDNRSSRLMTRDQGYSVAAYVRRCQSALYSMPTDLRPMHTHDVVALAAERFATAVEFWKERFRRLTQVRIREILALIPEDWASSPARAFAEAMIRCNLDLLFAPAGAKA